MSFLSQHSRFLVLLSVLISLFTAGLGYFNKRNLEVEKRNLMNTKAHLTATQNTLAQMLQNEADAKKQLTATASKLEQISATFAISQEDLKKASTKITDLSHQLTTKDIQIAKLKDQTLAQESKIKELTSATSQDIQAQREAELTTQLAEQKTLVAKLQTQVERAQNKIQEYVKKEFDRQKLQTRLGLEGKVLAVNQAWNFVVLSIGNKNGVANNAEMLVKRGSQLIGKVRVTSVEPSTSVADIVSLSKGQSVQAGDNVIYEMTNDE